MAEVDETKISVTAEQLEEAVSAYELVLPSEMEEIYQAMLKAPRLGVLIAQSLTEAVKSAKRGKMQQERVLDMAVVPAFLTGLLVGRLQKEQECDYCVAFRDTGKRHYPKVGQWFSSTAPDHVCPHLALGFTALEHDADRYAILEMVDLRPDGLGKGLGSSPEEKHGEEKAHDKP